jgi:hypothetical protein
MGSAGYLGATLAKRHPWWRTKEHTTRGIGEDRRAGRWQPRVVYAHTRNGTRRGSGVDEKVALAPHLIRLRRIPPERTL